MKYCVLILKREDRTS